MTINPRRAWLLITCSTLVAAGCHSASKDTGSTSAATDRGQEDTATVVDRGPAGPPDAVPAPPPEPRIVELEGIRVFVDEGRVELAARTCLDVGWLEQVACSPGTREHESLVVVPARPSDVHAALLLAGFEAGRPGHWSYENEQYRFVAPTGDRLEVLVRYPDAAGEVVTEPVARWISDYRGREAFPDVPWVFGGSRIAPNTPEMGPGEHYVADMTGSVIGLVTFGDEPIGFSEVIADESAVMAPQWVVDTDRVPAMGTDVTIVIRRPAAGTSATGRGPSVPDP
ncbi:MAG: YdjY domain-containing protein [Planctomycetota bacterium]|jgi:hypothetical protein